MLKRARKYAFMLHRTLNLRSATGGVVVGCLLMHLFWGNFLLQGDDVEQHPWPIKNTYRQTSLSSRTQRACTEKIGETITSSDSPFQPAPEPTMQNLMCMLQTLHSKFDHTNEDIRNMKEDLSDIKEGVKDIQDAHPALQQEVEFLKDEVVDLRRENDELKRRMLDTERKADNLEGRSKRSNLIFYGLPRKQNETQTDCEGLISSVIANKLDLTGDFQLVYQVHRLNAKHNSPVVPRCTFYKVARAQCHRKKVKVLSADTVQRTFDSPNYPNNYPSNAYCQWLLSAPSEDYVIRLDTLAMDLEATQGCVYDSITVYNGEKKETSQLRRYCVGYFSIYSTGRYLLVVFKSDESYEAGGFRLRYVAILKNPPTVRTTVSATTAKSEDKGNRNWVNTGALIGGVVGGVCFVIILGIVCGRCVGRGELRQPPAHRAAAFYHSHAPPISPMHEPGEGSAISAAVHMMQGNNTVFMVSQAMGTNLSPTHFSSHITSGVTNMAFDGSGEQSVEMSATMSIIGPPPPTYTDAMLVTYPPKIPPTPKRRCSGTAGLAAPPLYASRDPGANPDGDQPSPSTSTGEANERVPSVRIEISPPETDTPQQSESLPSETETLQQSVISPSGAEAPQQSEMPSPQSAQQSQISPTETEIVPPETGTSGQIEIRPSEAEALQRSDVLPPDTDVQRQPEMSPSQAEVQQQPEMSPSETVSQQPEMSPSEADVSQQPEMSASETEVSQPEMSPSDAEVPQQPELSFSEAEVPQQPEMPSSEREVSQQPEMSSSEREVSQQPEMPSSEREVSQQPEMSSSEREVSQQPEMSSSEAEVSQQSEMSPKTEVSQQSEVPPSEEEVLPQTTSQSEASPQPVEADNLQTSVSPSLSRSAEDYSDGAAEDHEERNQLDSEATTPSPQTASRAESSGQNEINALTQDSDEEENVATHSPTEPNHHGESPHRPHPQISVHAENVDTDIQTESFPAASTTENGGKETSEANPENTCEGISSDDIPVPVEHGTENPEETSTSHGTSALPVDPSLCASDDSFAHPTALTPEHCSSSASSLPPPPSPHAVSDSDSEGFPPAPAPLTVDMVKPPSIPRIESPSPLLEAVSSDDNSDRTGTRDVQEGCSQEEVCGARSFGSLSSHSSPLLTERQLRNSTSFPNIPKQVEVIKRETLQRADSQ